MTTALTAIPMKMTMSTIRFFPVFCMVAAFVSSRILPAGWFGQDYLNSAQASIGKRQNLNVLGSFGFG